MHLPDEQLRAGHIPTELYRQIPPGTDPRKVVIVQEAPRSYKGPILLTLTITAGSVVVLLVVAFVVQIVAASIVAVLSASCGLSYTFSRAAKSKKTARPVVKGRSRAPRKRPARSVRAKSRYRK
ncbi:MULTISPECIES: hypothetical protein [unclassified Streptomyces]|uniref:hypothetical protein n=1 Tax=unclassified Streptomyces TaxID=2593676 RepID=UPI002E159484|nr:hypothetical protein OG533_27625 [Streptomyces sp. NBC_01186]WSS44078.1 hypothetical protein OG220_28430 [Streptomyces sp. NBC_01187]